MKQPIWLINGMIMLLGITCLSILYFLQFPVVRKVSIEPDKVVDYKPVQVTIAVETSKIYGVNDLFNTYVPAPIAPAMVQPTIPPIPTAPSLIPFEMPILQEKVAIPPLEVVLKGIMYNNYKPEKSVIIIQFNNSKEEMNYQQGQLINDAQILKVYPNRVLLIRANGQQEILYLTEKEATKNAVSSIYKSIEKMVIDYKNGVYHIPYDQFVKIIGSLGNFVDQLGLTTVYHKGKSIGCRVSKTDKNSLADKLGLIREDIIQFIDGLPVHDVASRIIIFNHICTKRLGDIIVVKIDRLGKPTQLEYLLVGYTAHGLLTVDPSLTKSKHAQDASSPSPQKLLEMEEERKKILEKKIKLAPTAQQLEMEERRKMFDLRRNQMLDSNSIKTVQQGVS